MGREQIQTKTQLRALSWNLFHGRDFPPDRSLLTLRSRLFGRSERNATHLQVNHNLFGSFAELISSWRWDVALLQESPPHWRDPLARACGAQPVQSLTSRNSLGAGRRLLATLNPDLIGSNEGGSNLLLVRGGPCPVRESRELVLAPGPRPERRTMVFAKLASGLSVACIHASVGAENHARAEGEVIAAAETALGWANGEPLIFGGDFNLRPRQSKAFDELEQRLGLKGATAPGAIDHILSSGLVGFEPAQALASEEREVRAPGGLAIRLSDHAPVFAGFERPDNAATPAERG